MRRLVAIALAAVTLGAAHPARTEPEFAIAIRDHRFDPSELHVPASVKIKIVITNRDSTAEEFESYTLGVEKRIKGNATGAVYVGPLKPGRYPFVGEYHEHTAQGVLVAE